MVLLNKRMVYIMYDENFNTSNVMVLLNGWIANVLRFTDFNTSNVMVLHGKEN